MTSELQVDASVDEWSLLVPGWFIQEGSMPELEVGCVVDFAVEALPTGTISAVSRSADPHRHHLYDARYHLCAVAQPVRGGVVMDLGFPATCISQVEGRPPEQSAEGFSLCGEFDLVVDAVDSTDVRARRVHWAVLEIGVDVAPWVHTELDAEASEAGWARISGSHEWRTIERTNSWSDDRGRATYLIRCRLFRQGGSQE